MIKEKLSKINKKVLTNKNTWYIMEPRKAGNIMLKIPTKVSVMISIVLSVLFFVIIIGGAMIMPWLTKVLSDISPRDISANGRMLVLVLAYVALFIMTVADTMLFALLLRVRAGKVFTVKSVALIRGISWCALFLGVAFVVLGIYFKISYFVAFAAVFVGICIRVVKNVIEQATEIKAENDFTI